MASLYTRVLPSKRAKLVIPAFTKGKDQLDPVDVEATRGIACLRIHVERVIGLLSGKYTILQGTLPTDFLICNPHGSLEERIPALPVLLLLICVLQ